MSIPFKLVLLAIFSLAATAIAAAPAFPQSEPLVHNQTPRLIVQQEVHAASDVGCPAVTPSPAPVPSPTDTAGGCRIHGAGFIAFVIHLSAGGTEATISVCDVELDMRVDAAGEGYMSHQELTGLECHRRACAQATPPTSEGRAWSFLMQEAEPSPREKVTVLLCSEPTDMAGPTHCEVPLLLNTTGHSYRITAPDISGHGTFFPHCEVSGFIQFEGVLGTTGEAQAAQRIEVRHT